MWVAGNVILLEVIILVVEIFLSSYVVSEFYGDIRPSVISPVFLDLTGYVWQVFGSPVTWCTKSCQNLTQVGFGRSLVYQVT